LYYKRVVPSAYKIGTDLSLTNLGKLFINTRGSKGPKTEPWGNNVPLPSYLIGYTM